MKRISELPSPLLVLLVVAGVLSMRRQGWVECAMLAIALAGHLWDRWQVTRREVDGLKALVDASDKRHREELERLHANFLQWTEKVNSIGNKIALTPKR